jgi:uncharacterized phage protein (TIGR01671 family)
MNRPIKFRTWDKQNKEFSEWTNRDPFFSTSHEKIFFWERIKKEDGSYGGDVVIEDYGDRFVLQQFTGVLDKNGKEIYEGDILKYKSSDPRFDQTVVRWTHDYEDNHPGFVISSSFCQSGNPEIVGNIFETPDLLK